MKRVRLEPSEKVPAELAIRWLPPGDRIHTLLGRRDRQSLVGAYRNRADIEARIRAAGVVDIAGPLSRRRGYGLAILMDNSMACLFIRADVPDSAVIFKADVMSDEG